MKLLYFSSTCVQAEEKANLLMRAVGAHSQYTKDVREISNVDICTVSDDEDFMSLIFV